MLNNQVTARHRLSSSPDLASLIEEEEEARILGSFRPAARWQRAAPSLPSHPE